MDAAVVVPVKALTMAKQRLDPHLDAELRGRLARWMAERVVAACSPLTVLVVCDDDDVSEWAVSLGADVVTPRGPGLNRAVDDGVRAAVDAGFEHVIVTHADLPVPDGLAGVAREGTITLVPDRRRDGTNVMAFPTDHPVAADYGDRSFRRHLARATTLVGNTDHLCLEVRSDPDLGLDVDTPNDLRHPRLRKVLPSWLPTNPDNPSTRRT